MSNTIYIIKEAEQVRNEQDIYKIGMTRKTIQKRISQYRKGSKVIFCLECKVDCNIFEKHLIDEFKKYFIQRTDYGREYFEGDSFLMIKKIIMDYEMLISKYDIDITSKNTELNAVELENIDNIDEIDENNIIFKFLNSASSNYYIEEGATTLWNDFLNDFRKNSVQYITSKDIIFSKMGLEIIQCKICKFCKNKHIKGCCSKYDRIQRTSTRIK